MRDETVDLDVSVCAVREVKCHAADRWSSNWSEGIAVGGEWRDATVEAEPDHHFERVGAAGSGAEESIVGGFVVQG